MYSFSGLSYLIRHAPIDIVCENRAIVWMNYRWYLRKDNVFLDESFPENDFDKALKWLVDPFWERNNGHPYKIAP